MERASIPSLEDPDVKRWHENLVTSSVITAGVYLRTTGLCCKLVATTPKEILAEASTTAFRDAFIDFVRQMETEGKAGSYIELFRKVILSWTAYNGLAVQLKVNIKGRNESPTLKDERVPMRDELSKVILPDGSVLSTSRAGKVLKEQLIGKPDRSWEGGGGGRAVRGYTWTEKSLRALEGTLTGLTPLTGLEEGKSLSKGRIPEQKEGQNTPSAPMECVRPVQPVSQVPDGKTTDKTLVRSDFISKRRRYLKGGPGSAARTTTGGSGWKAGTGGNMSRQIMHSNFEAKGFPQA